MLDISKVRRIAKAQFGLSIPSGNPYMTTDGLAAPRIIPGTDYSSEFKNAAQQITAPTDRMIDFNAKNGDLFSLKLKTNSSQTNPPSKLKPTSELETFYDGLGIANSAMDLANGLAFSKLHSLDSATTYGLNKLWDGVSNAVDPLTGLAMKTGTLVANAARSLGTNTSGKTGFDKFSNSTIGQLTGIGIINGAFGKKTRDFSADQSTILLIGSSYGGTVRNINEAVEGAGKKYGLFSTGARRRMNSKINLAETLQNTMRDIADEAADRAAISTHLSLLLHMQNEFNLNGGIDLRYIRGAKFGAKLQRIKKIDFHKKGGEIKNPINLDDWQPTITEAPIEWTPVISFLDGGKSEELPEVREESKIEETTLKNVIPEGALHAHKHHMENAEELTKKGIPVIDNDGDLQAEIERNEIIFTLEVTKKLEELYSKYNGLESSQKEKDEAAVEAGKLLVEQILFNTDDRTGLINTLELGGVIDGTK